MAGKGKVVNFPAKGRDAALADSRRASGSFKLRWLEAVARSPGLPSLATRVAVLIAKYYDAEKGYAWPSIPRLARELDMSEKAVRRALWALKDDAGLLEITVHRGRNATNEFHPTIPDKTSQSREVLKDGKTSQNRPRKPPKTVPENLPEMGGDSPEDSLNDSPEPESASPGSSSGRPSGAPADSGTSSNSRNPSKGSARALEAPRLPYRENQDIEIPGIDKPSVYAVLHSTSRLVVKDYYGVCWLVRLNAGRPPILESNSPIDGAIAESMRDAEDALEDARAGE